MEEKTRGLQDFLNWLEDTPVCVLKFTGTPPLSIHYSSADYFEPSREFKDFKQVIEVDEEQFVRIVEAFKYNSVMEKLALDCQELDSFYHDVLTQNFKNVLKNKVNLEAFKIWENAAGAKISHAFLRHFVPDKSDTGFPRYLKKSKLRYLEFGDFYPIGADQMKAISTFVEHNANLTEVYVRSRPKLPFKDQLEANQDIIGLYKKMQVALSEFNFEKSLPFSHIPDSELSHPEWNSRQAIELRYLKHFHALWMRNQLNPSFPYCEILNFLEQKNLALKDFPMILKYMFHLLAETFMEKLPNDLWNKLIFAATYCEDPLFFERELMVLTPMLATPDSGQKKIFYQRILYLAIVNKENDWFRIACSALKNDDYKFKFDGGWTNVFPVDLLVWESFELERLAKKTPQPDARVAVLGAIEYYLSGDLEVKTETEVKTQYGQKLGNKLIMAIKNPDWIELIKKDFPLTKAEWKVFNEAYREAIGEILSFDSLKAKIFNLQILGQIEAYSNFSVDKKSAFQGIFNEVGEATTVEDIYDAIHNLERNNLIMKNQTLKKLDPDSIRYKVHDWLVNTFWFNGQKSSCGNLLSQLIVEVDKILTDFNEDKARFAGDKRIVNR